MNKPSGIVVEPSTDHQTPPTDRQIIDDLRQRLTDAEKKLKGARLELRGQRERTYLDVVYRSRPPVQGEWLETARLVELGILRSNKCRICDEPMFWAISTKTHRWRPINEAGGIHYHNTLEIDHGRKINPIPEAFGPELPHLDRNHKKRRMLQP